tara:strand:- start:279 stop:860 length:582 start_codon:yes stop_codon:yes gene_type:complete
MIKKYKTIVADPPWKYSSPGQFGNTLKHRPNRDKSIAKEGAGSVARYGAMSLDELSELNVAGVSDDNAHLYLWTTNKFMEEAHILARNWGFEPKTICTWGKVKADGSPSMKMGYYFRGATEHFLFCVKGSLRINSRNKPTLFQSKRLPHSVKPEWFYEMVEAESIGPRLEMFARRERDGWDVFGNEVDNSISL